MTSPSHKAPETPGFIRKQFEFTAHLRDPASNPLPEDVEDRRMAIYRELFYNNVEDFMAKGFPVIRSLMDDESWHTMIRDYFSRHRATTPLFPEMTQEFIRYLEEERNDPDDPPFLLELAHYEWVELALSIAEDEIDLEGIDPGGDLLEGCPVLSPLAWPLSYRFEVHRISPEYLPDTPGNQPTCIVVYRGRDDKVSFLEINPVTARLLQLLSENTGITGKEALLRIAEELQHLNPATVIDGGLEIMNDLLRRDILLGTRH